MNINVSEIIEEKIKEMDENKVIENVIKDTIEKTIIKSFTDALGGWDVKRGIEDKVHEEVMKVVKDMDFQTYNSFMLDTMKQIINGVCREDLCNKAADAFKNMFLCQTKEIKLSSIFKKFREIACDEVDESEKYDRAEDGWHCKLGESSYGWLECELDFEDNNFYSKRDSKIAFSVHRNYDNKKIGTIGILYLDGDDINKSFKLGSLNEVELLLVQAKLNDIPIIIDVEDEDDIDNSFDVDY